MDVLSVITVLAPFVGPVVKDVLGDLWDDYRSKGKQKQGALVTQQGDWQPIPSTAGVLTAPSLAYAGMPVIEPSILVTGEFLADEFVADMADLLLDYEDQVVLLLVVNENTGDVYFCEYDFDGYALSLWPGTYSLYAFIVDPILDELLGLGFPDSGYIKDPNPLYLSGEGILDLDFLILDPEDIV